MNLQQFVIWLESQGCLVTPGSDGYGVTGADIRGVIWYRPFESRADDRQICLDRRDCYDKPSRCPILLPLPQDEAQVAFLAEKLAWLRSPAGYAASNEYQYEEWVEHYESTTP